MIIPLVDIPVKSKFTLNNSFNIFTFTTGHIINGETFVVNPSPLFTFQNISTTLFIIISSILFIRFAINIFSIIRKIIKSKKVDYLKTSLVLIEEKTPPYSFFRYVFVNRSDFENGKIEKELLMHEEAHCLQYHSIDVIIIELLNVILWFNPAIWLFRKAILLNHEYYADHKVLTISDYIDYHQLLLNLIVQNNSNYLVSNFKYSLIKNRLIMMTLSGPSNNAILRKIAAISLFLFLGIAFTFSQDNKLNSNAYSIENGWWKPILQKHKIDVKQFNYKNIVNMGMNDTINDLMLEMGTSDSLNNRNVPFKDAIFISKGIADTYWIMTSALAHHDLDNNIIVVNNGKMECFSFKSTYIIATYKSTDIIPFKSFSFQEVKIDVKRNMMFTSGL